MTQSVILFQDKRPDSLFLHQVYDPDIDGEYVENNGKLIPKPGSLVIEKSTGNLYYVSFVDERYKSTLLPCRLVITSEGEEVVKILSYGNDKFYLFYDDRTKPTKLNIDGKLIVFGASLAEYRLVKTNSSKETEIISIYMNNNEEFKGERIPLANIGEKTGAKQLTNCHTLVTLQDGDVVEAEIYDNLGILSIVVQLFVKRATILNDLASTNDIIVDFDANSNQMLGSDFYLYQRQDPSHLAITPRLVYCDGSSEDITINNIDCFLYGLENFVPSFPGQKQKIMIKKYLTYKQMSTISKQIGDKRFVTCEKIINVLANKTLDGIKVSLMPIWDNKNNIYYLKYIAYSDKRDKVIDVTNYVTPVTMFCGDIFNQQQVHTFDIDLQNVFDVSVTVPYRQVSYIHLKPYNEFQRYTLSDNSDLDPIYGVDASTIRRPVIMYDSVIEQYYIPTSRFKNKEAFLEAFYYNANPPFDVRESLEAPVPTHFTIRALDTLNTMITVPIEIEQYAQSWNITRQGDPSMLVGYNVIVEFLQYTSSGEYLILYGVPVDVHLATSKYDSYNTETNNLP